jgi:hypothetical protein
MYGAKSQGYTHNGITQQPKQWPILEVIKSFNFLDLYQMPPLIKNILSMVSFSNGLSTKRLISVEDTAMKIGTHKKMHDDIFSKIRPVIYFLSNHNYFYPFNVAYSHNLLTIA